MYASQKSIAKKKATLDEGKLKTENTTSFNHGSFCIERY